MAFHARIAALLVLALLFTAAAPAAAPAAQQADGKTKHAKKHKKAKGKKKAKGNKKPKIKITRRDLDGDGIPNKRDPDIDGDGKPNGRDRNTDGDRKLNRGDRDIDADGKPNARDPDMDGDGISNASDRDVDADGLLNGDDRDVDADGTLNRRDTEIDGDRLPNGRDNDMDGDGLPNGDDPDMDGDGVPNTLDTDMDGDGVPNHKDLDVDGNGISNDDDTDTDGDGILDWFDLDMDGDGRPNGLDNDTDGDGIPDYLDGDIDGDKIPNYIDNDSDGTGDNVTKLPEQVVSRVPRSFFGLVADEILWAPTRRARDGVIDQAKSTGVGTIRQLFDWSSVELQPGVYEWRHYDDYVEDVTRAGFAILPVLYHPPRFHEGRSPGDTTHGTYPPADNASLAAYAASAALRYGPNGSFWEEHPDVPKRPIRSWQIWNEPNLKVYWLPAPNPAGYTAMLKTVGSAIRAVDPGAEIVAAGLPHSRAGVPVVQFVRDMYAAGAKGSFDTLAIHPYAGAADGVYTIVNWFRAVLDENGDTDKHIWITELGWATGGPEHPFNIGQGPQAELIKRVIATLVAQSSQLKLRGLIYFNWRDLPPDPKTGDRWGLHTGLFRRDGSEKPGFTAFSDALSLLISG